MRILQQSQCFKEKNYIVKFSTSSIFKKISKDNFETKNFFKKKKQKKRRRNQFWVKKKKACKKKPDKKNLVKKIIFFLKKLQS